MSERRKEFEIPQELCDPEWKTNKVVIKNLTGRIGMRMRDESGGKEGIAATLSLLYSVIEAPWKVNDRDVLLDLDMRVFTILAKEVKDFNSAVKSNTKLYGQYFHEMLKRGVYLPPAQFEAFFISAAHSKEDLDKTIEANYESLQEISK